MTEPYAASGVDTEAGDLAVSLMKKAVSATHNDKVFGSLGGFAYGLERKQALLAKERAQGRLL